MNEVVDDDMLEATRCLASMELSEEPLPTPDGLVLANYEANLFCLPTVLTALQTGFEKPVFPGREKFFCEPEYTWLQQVYKEIYQNQEFDFIPRRYVEYKEVEVFGDLFTSNKAAKGKSSLVAAIWKKAGGIHTSSPLLASDVRIGQVQYFFTHVLHSTEQEYLNNIFAYVRWYQDHPRKFYFGDNIFISSTVFDSDVFANIVPLCRLMTRCAFTNLKETFDYGQDNVYVCIPMIRKIHI